MGKGKKLLVGAALVGGAAMIAKKLKGKSKEEIVAEVKKARGRLSEAVEKVKAEVEKHKSACGCGAKRKTGARGRRLEDRR